MLWIEFGLKGWTQKFWKYVQRDNIFLESAYIYPTPAYTITIVPVL